MHTIRAEEYFAIHIDYRGVMIYDPALAGLDGMLVYDERDGTCLIPVCVVLPIQHELALRRTYGRLPIVVTDQYDIEHPDNHARLKRVIERQHPPEVLLCTVVDGDARTVVTRKLALDYTPTGEAA